MSVKIVTVQSAEAKNIDKAIASLDGVVGKVGWFEGSKYPDKASTPVAYVAVIQEYGYPGKNIPARPFMEPAKVHHGQEWTNALKLGADAVIAGKTSAQAVMEQVGQLAAGHIREAIIAVTEPALKPATIARRLRKKSDQRTTGLLTKPLIDTGLMIATVINTVENE